MAFFDEWKDTAFSLTLTKVLVGLLTLLGIFFIVNTDIDNPMLLGYLIISGLVVFIAAQTEKEKSGELLQANFFKDKNTTYIALIGGLLIGGFFGIMQRGGGLALVLPIQSLYIGDLNFFLVNILAPILEPLFWRGWLFPTVLAFTTGIFKGNFKLALAAALLISAFSFGIYHVNVYFSQAGGFEKTYEIMFIAVVFAVIFIIFNQLAQCVAAEIGWHFANNMFSAGYATSEIWATAAVWLIGMAVLIELSDRFSRKR